MPIPAMREDIISAPQIFGRILRALGPELPTFHVLLHLHQMPKFVCPQHNPFQGRDAYHINYS